MNYHDKTIDFTARTLHTDVKVGLTESQLEGVVNRNGYNVLSKKKRKSFFGKLTECLKEPMLIILIFSFIIALGTGLGGYLKTGQGDFTECIGIFLAIILSVSITLFMEGSSEKAFLELNKIYDNVTVKVIRNGQIIVVNRKYVTVGDLLIIENGDKIVADGRLTESEGLSVDESALTGESHSIEKDANVTLNEATPLAERKNYLYSGTFVSSGNGKMIVTAIGDDTEMGKIAGELKSDKSEQSPLQYKLAKLGKIIAITGFACAFSVFVISFVRLALTGSLNFTTAQELFISCIVLIVAAVPEGLPTIVAVSLALGMIKLAKENALIKKMIATETAGAVSVICSDKTGTLTQNKMTVRRICSSEFCSVPDKRVKEVLVQNFICNSTANILTAGKKSVKTGSGTECALLEAVKDKVKNADFLEYRRSYPVVYREPFTSESKFMITVIKSGEKFRVLLKGAPEKVLSRCNLSEGQKQKIFKDMSVWQKKARRVICFAHCDLTSFENPDGLPFVYDGFATLFDPLRQDVKEAVKDCLSAGIKVKILTGDNINTATAIAEELNLPCGSGDVINAADLEKLDDRNFIKAVSRVSVIARSTPIVKLRVVKALKSLGEVVAVTGDGINDAPAIKRADIGIAMGVSGSEITKEAADVVLLDDSFATVVKTVAFGRNVFKNLQRFILFQLSVNLSALLFVTVCAVIGLPSPFNTLQLLWINVIMDGPPAITLGLEQGGRGLMKAKPIDKKESIVSAKMLVRIIFNGVFIGGVMIAQYLTNFLSVKSIEQLSAAFTLFVFFQLFNAFNSRELGAESIFESIGKNKIMVVTFSLVLVIHIVIVQFAYKVFGIYPMSLLSWIKCSAAAFSIIAVSELYKGCYRTVKKFVTRKTLDVKNGSQELKIAAANK